MTLNIWLAVAAIVLVLIAAVLAVAETAMTQVTRARASAMAEQGRRGADRVQRIVDNIERDLNGVYRHFPALQQQCHSQPLDCRNIRKPVILQSHYSSGSCWVWRENEMLQ